MILKPLNWQFTVRREIHQIMRCLQKNFLLDRKNDNCVKGGFKLSFYGGLKMYDLGGLRTDRC